LFYTAQGILRARAHRYSDDELIEKLRSLYQRHGYLSGLIIDEAEGMPSAAAYAHRFGSLIRAYQTVGFTPDRDYQYLEVNQFLRRLHPEIVGQTERMIAEVGGAVERDPATDLLTVNREFTVSLVLARCQLLDNGRRRWKVRFDTSLAPDITVAVRLMTRAIRRRWITTCCRGWISASRASIWPITTASSSSVTASTAWTTCTAWPGASASEGRMTNKEHRHSELRMIPLDRIEVLNPRERNSRVFEQIVGNIQSIGLKKPIIVTPRPGVAMASTTCSSAAKGASRPSRRSASRKFRRW
jgi:hypothetical protein